MHTLLEDLALVSLKVPQKPCLFSSDIFSSWTYKFILFGLLKRSTLLSACIFFSAAKHNDITLTTKNTSESELKTPPKFLWPRTQVCTVEISSEDLLFGNNYSLQTMWWGAHSQTVSYTWAKEGRYFNGQQHRTHDCRKVLILKKEFLSYYLLRQHPYFQLQFTDSASAFSACSLTESSSNYKT